MRKVSKIIYLNPTSEVGGAERSLLDLLKHLDKEKYRPVVCIPSEGKLMWEARRIGVETKVIPLHPEISKLSRENGNRYFYQLLSIPWYLLPTIIKMARFVRSKDVDMIVTNGIKCHFIGSMVSSLTGSKLIWHVRDLVEKGWLKWALRFMGGYFPDKIITNSSAVGGIFPGNKKKETVYNGIDLSHFRPGINGKKIRSEFKVGRDTKLNGTIGHLAPLKGYEELTDAMVGLVREGCDVKLAIVGEAIYQNSNSYKQRLLSLVYSKGLKDRVIFVGFREDIPDLLASFDVFVLPSRSEGFGRVNLEAMAMGKPIIASNLSGFADVLTYGIEGLLVPPCDDEGLAQALTSLITDRKLRGEMRARGIVKASNYGWESIAKRIVEYYNYNAKFDSFIVHCDDDTK